MSNSSTESEGPSAVDKIKDWFAGPERGEDAQYTRRLLDGRIEKYLDKNFNSYIQEYGMVRSVDLKQYDERADRLVPRVDKLLVFSRNTDAEVSNLELRVADIKKKAKKKGSKK